MQADIANKNADTAYKQGLLRYEPWKVMAAGIAAGATLTLAIMAVMAALLGHWHP